MQNEFFSDNQKKLFAEIEKAGELVFACGPRGMSANIVGEFCVRYYPEKKEHRLEMGDGSQHIHIDWSRVKFVEYSLFHGEGVLSFKDGDEILFRLYRIDGEFSSEVKNLVGLLIEKTEQWRPLTLKTDRLILRAIDLSDADAIFQYAKNPNVSRFTLWEPHKSLEDTIEYINEYVFDYYSKGVPEPLGIALKESPEKIIGTVGCFWVSEKSKSMELAYALAEEHWGKGLVAEASAAVMNYCFKEFGLKRIQARCKVENIASSAVMIKTGMAYEGTLKSAIFHREKFWDMHYYAKVVD